MKQVTITERNQWERETFSYILELDEQTLLEFKNGLKNQSNVKIDENTTYTKEQVKDELRNWDGNRIYDESIRDNLEELLNFQYHYEAETKIHAKLTVTELKRLSQLEEEETGLRLKGIGSSGDISRIPNFIKKDEPVKGAHLGTLYHKILDDKSILEITSREDLEKHLISLYNSGDLTPEEFTSINQDKIHGFLNSDVATRMRKASVQNALYTEQQFIMGVKAKEINAQMKSDELVLIQGVIDVYFEENEELILLDYKTDKVDYRYGEETLKKRYSVQLDYYQRALKQLTGKRVKERIIYSFELNKEISV